MKIESIEQLQSLVQIVLDNKLEILEVDNIKIVRTRHEYPQPKQSNAITTLDDELFGPGSDSSQGFLNG